MKRLTYEELELYIKLLKKESVKKPELNPLIIKFEKHLKEWNGVKHE